MVSRRVKSKGGSPEEHPDRPPQSCCIVFCIIREVIDIAVLNEQISQIVQRENTLRAEIDAIIAEIEEA